MAAERSSGRAVCLLVAAAIMSICVMRAPVRAQQAPTFRAGTEAAWMTATVVDRDGHLLTDLKKEDFEIREKGEIREITTFRSDPIPFAAVVMIDISGSMDGAEATVHRAVDELIKNFQAGDRLTIASFDTVPHFGAPFTSNREILQRSIAEVMSSLSQQPWCLADPVGQRATTPGWTALWDGIGCGIVMAASDTETPRRVVIVISDGMDNYSQLTIGEVIDRANTYGVMVYAIGLAGTDGVAAGDMRGIAEASGGGYYSLSDRNQLVGSFAQIAEELRHQYVLGFSPSQPGEKLKGVEVRSLRTGTETHSHQVFLTTAPVHASGAIVPPAPAPAAAPAAAPPAPSSSGPPSAPTMVIPGTASPAAAATRPQVATVLDRFASPGWVMGQAPLMTIDQLRTIQRDLRRDVPPWIASVPEADRPRRRLTAAAFVLDLLSTQNDPYLWNLNQPAWNLLDWTEGMLREGPPVPAERQWYLGAMGLLECADVAKELDLFVGRALGRFPNDERFALVRAVAQDLNTWPALRDHGQFSPPPGVASLIVSRYQEAAALPSVRQEALLRLGYFELRRGRVDAALAQFKDVGDPQEQFLRYWLGLFQGQALQQGGRIDEAIASYQRAFDQVPFARSATVALSAALVAGHRDADAQRLAARMLASPAPADPWTVYVLPDYRFWSLVVGQLRNAVTQ